MRAEFRLFPMLFGKHVNKYYLRYLPFFLIGVVALIFVDVCETFIPRYLGQIVDDGGALFENKDELWKLIGIMLGLAFSIFVGRIIWRLTIQHASYRISFDLRQSMFRKSERLSLSFYHETKVGTIMNWFTSDVEQIQDFFAWGTVMLVDAVFMSAVVVFSMIQVSWALTLIALLPMILIIIWGVLCEKYMSLKWEQRQEAEDKVYDFAQENFMGIRVIKAFVKQNREIHAFAKVVRKTKDVNISVARVSVLFDNCIEVILAFEICFVLGFGGFLVYHTASNTPIEIFGQTIRLTAGGLVQFFAYIDLLIWPMIALGSIVSMRARAKTSLKRISNFLDAPEDVKSPENATVLTEVKGKIEFRDFCFTYPDAQDEYIHNVSFSINPGETVGIVGKVGCGKTTLANILLRLYNVTPGTVFVDDVDIMDADIVSLRNAIAYAPQDNFLFSDKIENNVSFAKPTEDEEAIVEATRFSDVDTDIRSFPRSYQTVSGERGVTLSGGQKQRISLARAYYKKAPILILDDTVSAVDVKTEETILKNIADARKGQTTLVIASRVSTVRHMDKILVLDDGRVDAFGDHDTLMATSELYRQMVFLQTLEKEVEGGE